MSQAGRAPSADRTAVLTISRQLLTRYLPGAILLLAAAGFLTQGLAIATGSDFVFGLIPKLNPGGTRNIPQWFASAAFAVCAGCSMVLGLARHPAAPNAGRRWRVLAMMLALLSAERLAFVIASLERMTGAPEANTPLGLLTAVTALVTVGVYIWCIHDLPRRTQVLFASAASVFVAGLILSAAAPAASPRDPLQPRVVQMLMVSGARLLELLGVTLFLDAVAVHLRRRETEIRVIVDSALPHLVGSDERDGVLTIRLSRRRLRTVLMAGALALLVANVAAALTHTVGGREIEGAYRLFVVDFEGNLPTWYSSLLLLACACWLACVAAARHYAADPQWRQWALFALLFAALSADEAASLHELSVMPLRAVLSGNAWLRYPLILPGLAVTVVLYAFFAPFFRSLPARLRRQLYIGIGMVLAGALGVETVGGWFDPEVHGPNVTYVFLSTLEEGLEMTGVIVVLSAVLWHIEHHVGTLTIPGVRRAR